MERGVFRFAQYIPQQKLFLLKDLFCEILFAFKCKEFLMSSFIRSIFLRSTAQALPCAYHGCFGQPTCLRKLDKNAGASVHGLDPDAPPGSPSSSTFSRLCDNSLCIFTPCIKCRSAPALAAIREAESASITTCDHPICHSLLECLETKGRREIARLLKERPKQLIRNNDETSFEADDFAWDEIPGGHSSQGEGVQRSSLLNMYY
jgi:hypothetical protein